MDVASVVTLTLPEIKAKKGAKIKLDSTFTALITMESSGATLTYTRSTNNGPHEIIIRVNVDITVDDPILPNLTWVDEPINGCHIYKATLVIENVSATFNARAFNAIVFDESNKIPRLVNTQVN
ncbi:hypothetical protein [Chengkuizengella axinellae]|uniref:Uncharacterized protein n=1 Tax=Chengkuizengella axinellae TaxID=3064388 RepID=A0ABT9J4J2_9BACL|nr:hypothetical protein [Chengkuizengella sp. 2205SS18-9]MDP5276556.1 hypothetical protein [Chengkuizengella sp. 2205SS18-9]